MAGVPFREDKEIFYQQPNHRAFRDGAVLSVPTLSLPACNSTGKNRRIVLRPPVRVLPWRRDFGRIYVYGAAGCSGEGTDIILKTLWTYLMGKLVKQDDRSSPKATGWIQIADQKPIAAVGVKTSPAVQVTVDLRTRAAEGVLVPSVPGIP